LTQDDEELSPRIIESKKPIQPSHEKRNSKFANFIKEQKQKSDLVAKEDNFMVLVPENVKPMDHQEKSGGRQHTFGISSTA